MKIQVIRVVALGALLSFAIPAAGAETEPVSAWNPDRGSVVELATLMEHVISPAAYRIWDKTGVIIDKSGKHDLSPKTDEEWEKVADGAATLAEVKNMLMVPDRELDPQWDHFANELSKAGMTALKMAEAHDKDGLWDISGHIDEICTDCHDHYGIE